MDFDTRAGEKAHAAAVMTAHSTLYADLGFWPATAGDITNSPPRHYDMRRGHDYVPDGIEVHTVAIRNARGAADCRGLETTGFDLISAPSEVADWYDHHAVLEIYYAECKALARSLTGAEHTFTYDHLIREPGKQISGGGTDRSQRITGTGSGGGYIGAVHMDYTTNTTWDAYLALHGEMVPSGYRRAMVLNFWRSIGVTSDANPLVVCDARTVQATDLFETVVYGYGADNYSWHDIGIETYNVKASSEHRWYYFDDMQPDEVLVFKTFDSHGVIGNTCPHASFTNPLAPPGTPARRSIELRVLCFLS